MALNKERSCSCAWACFFAAVLGACTLSSLTATAQPLAFPENSGFGQQEGGLIPGPDVAPHWAWASLNGALSWTVLESMDTDGDGHHELVVDMPIDQSTTIFILDRDTFEARCAFRIQNFVDVHFQDKENEAGKFIYILDSDGVSKFDAVNCLHVDRNEIPVQHQQSYALGDARGDGGVDVVYWAWMEGKIHVADWDDFSDSMTIDAVGQNTVSLMPVTGSERDDLVVVDNFNISVYDGVSLSQASVIDRSDIAGDLIIRSANLLNEENRQLLVGVEAQEDILVLNAVDGSEALTIPVDQLAYFRVQDIDGDGLDDILLSDLNTQHIRIFDHSGQLIHELGDDEFTTVRNAVVSPGQADGQAELVWSRTKESTMVLRKATFPGNSPTLESRIRRPPFRILGLSDSGDEQSRSILSWYTQSYPDPTTLIVLNADSGKLEGEYHWGTDVYSIAWKPGSDIDDSIFCSVDQLSNGADLVACQLGLQDKTLLWEIQREVRDELILVDSSNDRGFDILLTHRDYDNNTVELIAGDSGNSLWATTSIAAGEISQSRVVRVDDRLLILNQLQALFEIDISSGAVLNEYQDSLIQSISLCDEKLFAGIEDVGLVLLDTDSLEISRILYETDEPVSRIKFDQGCRVAVIGVGNLWNVNKDAVAIWLEPELEVFELGFLPRNDEYIAGTNELILSQSTGIFSYFLPLPDLIFRDSFKSPSQ